MFYKLNTQTKDTKCSTICVIEVPEDRGFPTNMDKELWTACGEAETKSLAHLYTQAGIRFFGHC